MAKSALELGRKFEQLSREVEKRQRPAAKAAAAVVQRETLQRMRSATGGDLMLSGMGRTAAAKRGGGTRSKGKLGVRTKPTRGASDAFIVEATGPAQLVENDVKKHVVTSRYAKGATYSRTTAAGRNVKGRSTRESRQASVLFGLGSTGGGRRAVLNIGGGEYRRFTFASSKGRHPWRDGVRAAEPRALTEMRKVEAGAVKAAFK